MVNQLLSAQVQTFIEAHRLDDPVQLLLKYKNIFGLPMPMIVDQITGRRKAKEKLGTWYANNKLIYPPSISLEQSSSEQTAQYKTKILMNELGPTNLLTYSILDLTGGFGVDSFFFSKVFREVHFVEPNDGLLEISAYNHHQLGANNLLYYNVTAEEFLKSSIRCDVAYLDPSRRLKGNQKVFSLGQCEPDVLSLQEKIWEVSNYLLVKASPLLDIQQGLKELKYVKKVIVLSLNNECKELLFLCKKDFRSTPTIEATDINRRNYTISFQFADERATEVKYSDPLEYLYEPNASILKSGAFKTIASIFNVAKLHPSTHLYTSQKFIENFPGRIFQVQSLVKSDSKILKKFFPEGKANITTRNYTSNVDELRKKTGLKEGGDKYLIGCSGVQKKFLIVAKKLN